MRRYIEIYSIMLRNSLIREMSFKANFLLWMIVEVLWFCGQIVFFSIIFGQVDRIGDWTKWEVGDLGLKREQHDLDLLKLRLWLIESF